MTFCVYCNGTGVMEIGFKGCPFCGGRGFVPSIPTGYPRPTPTPPPCAECGGEGWVKTDERQALSCPQCNFNGFRR